MSDFNTLVTKLFKVRHPVVLAPMGGASGGRLAAAVSRAGGLGLVGASYGDANWMKTELAHMKDVTEPWGVGLVMFTVQKNMALLDLALSYRPQVVALSFGDVRSFVRPIHDRGALVVSQVHDVDQALAAVDAGVDAIIVQGAEAGGHSEKRATFPLIPAVRDAVGARFPLIAAGGIADGRGMAAALLLGADGVMMGTRFLASHEALPSQQVKQKLLTSQAQNTVRTRIFDLVRSIDWPPQYAGRALANQFSERWLHQDAELVQAPDSVRESYLDAIQQDDVAIRAIWAGEIVDLIQSIDGAESIIHKTIHEARAKITQAYDALLEPVT